MVISRNLLFVPILFSTLAIASSARADVKMSGVLQVSGSMISKRLKAMSKEERKVMDVMGEGMPEMGLMLGKPLGLSFYHSGQQERIDTKNGEMIYDYAHMKTITISRLDNEYSIDPLDPQGMTPAANQGITMPGMRLTVTKTSQTRNIVGHLARCYIVRGHSRSAIRKFEERLWLANDLPSLNASTPADNIVTLTAYQKEQMRKLKGLCLGSLITLDPKEGSFIISYKATSLSTNSLPASIFAVPKGLRDKKKSDEAFARIVKQANADAKALAARPRSKQELGDDLMDKAGAGRYEEVVRLLKAGADINFRNGEDWTPLMTAADSGEAKIVEFLLSKGALMEPPQKGENTPLILAAFNGNIETGKILLAHGAKIEDSRESGTPLVGAAMGNHPDFIRLLFEHHAEVDGKGGNVNQPTALAMVLSNAYSRADDAPEPFEVIKLLVDHGANVNAPAPDDGYPSLIGASYLGYARIVKLLLEHGADIHIKDNEGRTALQAASEAHHPEIVQMLTEAEKK